MKKIKKFTLSFLLIIAILITISGVVLHQKTYQASSEAQTAAKTAESTKDYLFFQSSGTAKASIVFYQGALVEETAYASLAKNLAQEGFDVYLSNVYLAGHSLGGVVACLNAADSESQAISGLILLASYPSEKTNLSDSNLKVLSITASNDKVLQWDNYEKAKKRLPDDTEYLTIVGGNHSGFGGYGKQTKDGKATISQTEQESQITLGITDFID
ncbi:alpha/beta hydrolase [Streptococcus sp.]|uniref:alpha/beta hydrolase n=1 Tax=Streptococcus sp. TaxID=1306 RepID=UPI0035292C1A